MKKKLFFVPITEIVDFAETASEYNLKAFVIGTSPINVVGFKVEYHPVKEKLAIRDLESTLNKGYCIDDTGDFDDRDV